MGITLSAAKIQWLQILEVLVPDEFPEAENCLSVKNNFLERVWTTSTKQQANNARKIVIQINSNPEGSDWSDGLYPLDKDASTIWKDARKGSAYNI